MSDALRTAASYLWVGLILYYFIQEMMNARKGTSRWAFYILGFILLLFVIWVLWKTIWSSDDKDECQPRERWEDIDKSEILIDDWDIPDELEDDIKEEKGTNDIPRRYRSQRRNFTLVDEVIQKDSTINYKYFKTWYLSPEFLDKYTSAIKSALRIKSKKLIEVRKQYDQDLHAIKSKDIKNDRISNIISSLDKTDDRRLLETTIAEIDDLLREIKRKYDQVDLSTTRKALTEAVNDPKNGIESLTGRRDIKDFLALQLYTFAQNPRIFFQNFQNMAIYGGSGVGKTKLAQVVGHVYASSGILVRNHVHIITKQSLTTAYVNESAKMTRKLLLANLESVVFIDEAYDLTPPKDLFGRSIDHGHEAITEMVNFMDKLMGLSLIIVAGYQDEMESRFMSANEGLPRRFPHILSLQPYSSHELTSILITFLSQTCPDISFNKSLSNYLYTVIRQINKLNPEIFKNQAGDMSNLSGSISKAIYGSPGKQWPKHGEDILLTGVNLFLASKGHTLQNL